MLNSNQMKLSQCMQVWGKHMRWRDAGRFGPVVNPDCQAHFPPHLSPRSPPPPLSRPTLLPPPLRPLPSRTLRAPFPSEQNRRKQRRLQQGFQPRTTLTAGVHNQFAQCLQAILARLVLLWSRSRTTATFRATRTIFAVNLQIAKLGLENWWKPKRVVDWFPFIKIARSSVSVFI